MIDRSLPGGASTREPGRRCFTEAECRKAIAEDEARLGRPMSLREREAFARGFLDADYNGDEIRCLAVLHAEPGDAEGKA